MRNELEFRNWLQRNGISANTQRPIVACIKRIERYYLQHLGLSIRDLDDATKADFESIRKGLLQIDRDIQGGGQEYRILMPRTTNPDPGKGLHNKWLYSLNKYQLYLSEESNDQVVFDWTEIEDMTDALPRLTHAPRGVQEPVRSQRELAVIGRDVQVRRWVLDRADGYCELCGASAPFVKPNGRPFMEVHHVHRLTDGGSDTPENAVALCPNCHREAHYGARSEEIRDQLAEQVSLLTSR